MPCKRKLNIKKPNRYVIKSVMLLPICAAMAAAFSLLAVGGNANNSPVFIIVTNRARVIFVHNIFVFNLKLLLTTLTELNAIAAPAIMGFKRNPLMG